MKRLLFSLGLLFYVGNACATVNPLVTDSVWEVLTRVGTTVDINESKIGILFDVNPCDMLIGQSDIPLVISTSGHYCLKEDVTFTTTAIVIDADDVLIDLNDYSISGGGTGTLCIGLSSGADNVTVRNGVLKDAARGIFTTTFGVGLNNGFTCQNVTFEDCTTTGLEFGNATNFTAAPFTFVPIQGSGFIVQDCVFVDCPGALSFTATSALVQRCNAQTPAGGESLCDFSGAQIIMEDCLFTTFDANVGDDNGFLQGLVMRRCSAVGGQGFILSPTMDNIVLEDCIARNQSGPTCYLLPFGDVVGATPSNITLRNCIAEDSDNIGFFVSFSDGKSPSIILDGCIARNCGSFGFLFFDNRSEFVLRNCVAQNNGSDGFAFTANFLKNGVISNCVSQANSGDGFTALNGSVSNFIFQDCIAQENAGDGFEVLGSLFNFSFKNCVAQDNVGDGFEFAATTTDCKIIDCTALTNGGIGINNAGGDVNYVLGCASLGNIGGDYVGITDLTLISSYSAIGGVAAANRWMNISS